MDHPKKGQKLTIKNGPLKGKYFEVINYLTTQHQGKDIKKIKAAHLTTAMVNRGHPLDEHTVFGLFWPEIQYGCVHDSELKVQLESVKPTNSKSEDTSEQEEPTNVESIKKG